MTGFCSHCNRRVGFTKLGPCLIDGIIVTRKIPKQFFGILELLNCCNYIVCSFGNLT